MDRISAYVYDESNVYNEAWARRLDIELNIRDNQATALEVAMYVRGEFAEDKQPLTDAQVTAAGIAREGKIGSIGYRIGRHACDSVMDALRNKVIEDTDALAIADFCPGNESVQGKGLKVIMDGGSKTEARARMEAELAKQKMAREVGVEGGTDLFGNALEDEAFWDFVAKYVVGRRNELAKDALFLRTNVGKRNSSAMQKKYGVDLKDPESLKKALKEIDMLRERWKNPYVEADLMEEIKQAWQAKQEGGEKPAAQVFERYAQRLREGEKGVTDYSAREEKEPVKARFLGTVGEAKNELKGIQGKVFRNAATNVEAMVTRNTIGKSHATQMSVRNLTALGYSAEEARQIHYSAYAKIAELFERAEHGEYEKNYDPESKRTRKGAWHYFGRVDVEGRGTFDVNVTAVEHIDPKAKNALYYLELTIENPATEEVLAYLSNRDSSSMTGSPERRLAAYRSFVEKEILKIREEAQKSGTYMEAPNGEASKLDERTWCMVRTRAFKDWFGDWENDPEGASKVVDENGEPMVVYHGTWNPELFKVFETSGGAFFTTSEEMATSYQDLRTSQEEDGMTLKKWKKVAKPRNYAVFLNIRKPWDISDVAPDGYVLPRTDPRNNFEAEQEIYKEKIAKLFGTDIETLEKAFKEAEAEEPWWEKGFRDDRAWKWSSAVSYFFGMWRSGVASHPTLMLSGGGVAEHMAPKVMKLLKRLGYDGMKYQDFGTQNDGEVERLMSIHNGNVSYIAFSPEQIKSVDNRGTFDGGNPNIDYSVRRAEEDARRGRGEEVFARRQAEGGRLTVSQAQERGMFKDGVMEVSNGVILAPDTDYSVDFMHVSPALFRKPDREHVGTGEGHQAYGWGVIYGMTNPGVNRSYHKQFTELFDGISFEKEDGKRRKDVPAEEAIAELKARGVTDEMLTPRWSLYWSLIRTRDKLLKERKHILEELDFFEEVHRLESETMQKFAESELNKQKQMLLIADYLLENNMFIEEGKKYPVNYRMRADVDDGNLLHWDDDAADIWKMHPELLAAISEEFGAPSEEGVYSGERIYNYLVDRIYQRDKNKPDEERVDARRLASEWLDAHGIRGVKYADGVTRYKLGEKTYNYVIFNPDYIEVIAINNRHPWSEYSEDNADWQRPEEVFGEGPVTDYSVAGMRARTAGANMDRVYRDPADGKEKFVIPTANARLSTGFTLGQLRAPVGGHKDVTLGAVLEYPELYEAYPELRGMRVRLYNPRLQEGVGGYFARPRGKRAGYLALNTGVEVTPERVMETLLHESQHAIQAIEGHAMGAGSMNAEEALEYLDRAIAARKGIMKAAGDDAWSRENLAYLQAMRGMVQGKEGRKMQEMAISQVYWYSHGEQEARFTGAGKDGDPMAEGSGLTENSPTTYTIAVPGEATELGGVTFGGMGRFSYLLESRLGTAGEFNYDRAVYQMKEAVVRRMKELRMLGDSKDERARGVQLAAEALATMESLESLLPATYRFGLEAYKVYFSSYAKLAGSGSAEAAGRMVPMAGWGERMKGAYEKIARMAVEGHFYKGDMEFWGEHWKKVERILPPLQEKWEKLMRDVGPLTGKARADAIAVAWMELKHELPEEMRTLMQAVGEVRADKLMAKFMERVALQLDAFRKDKTLGRIRRVVGALTPMPGENGKPVKGRMDAERYKKVVDMVRLMELTRGEKELFERERYTGEGTEKAWADLEPNDTVTVKTYDEDGNVLEIACSKEEYETYACFELMTASQAEAASRALGEYISTGRQAWDNAQEAARQRIAELCAPAMEKYGETENEKKARREMQQRKAMPLVKRTLNFLGFGLNDAQFFDACSKVPEIEKWTKDAVYRIASAHTYIEAKERDRQDFMTQAAREASGEKEDKKVREWLDETRRNRDTGIKLVPQEPDFAAQETETVRRQFMGLLRRKTHKKNFNPNTFAEALRYLTEEDGLMPEAVAREALDKYGTLGDAKASRLHGKEALMVLLTDNEYARFSDLTMTAKKRAEAAREKWQKEREEEDGKPTEKENGTLVLSPAQAAYRVLLCEQADYTESLSMQGYTPEVVQRLREFAGEKVMRMAYALREKMGERTEEIRDMYERVYGMPFPEVENYFRAFFDVAYETRQEGIMSGEGAGYAAGAGTVKILYHRNHRNAKIDPTMTMYDLENSRACARILWRTVVAMIFDAYKR